MMEYYRISICVPKPTLRWFKFGMRTLLGVMTAICVVASCVVLWAPRPQPSANPVPILGPITSGGPPVALPPPSDDEVMRALGKVQPVQGGVPFLFPKRRNNARIVKTKMADYVDPVRVYPMIGPAQRRHAHYKCTIHTGNAQDVVYVDHNHLHVVPNESYAGGVTEQ